MSWRVPHFRCPWIHDKALLLASCQAGVNNAIAQCASDPTSALFYQNVLHHVHATFGMAFVGGNIEAAVTSIASIQPSQQQVRVRP